MRFLVGLVVISISILAGANAPVSASRPEISVVTTAEVASQIPVRLKDIASVGSIEISHQLALMDLEILPALRADQEVIYKNSDLVRILKTKINEQNDLSQFNWIYFVPETLRLKATKNYVSGYAVQNELLAKLKMKCGDCVFQIKELKIPQISDKNEMQKWQVDFDQLKAGGSFVVPLTAYFSGKKETYWVSGVIKVSKKAPVATRQLQPGVRLQEADFQVMMVDMTFANDSFASAEELKGQMLNRMVSVNQPIFRADIKREFAIQRGQLIKAIIGNEVFEVTGQATAEEGGYLGDSIKIKNTETQKTLTGQIIERGVVRVQ